MTGLDPDARLMAEGAALAEREGVAVRWLEATAEATGLDGGTVDVVTAGQCWHWFERPAAVAEARRILRPGGLLAILYLDWIPLRGNAVAATEALIEEANPAWTMGGRHGMWPQWVPDVQAGGFVGVETFSFDLAIPYTPEGWRGRVRASAGITALDDDGRNRFDAALARVLARDFPGAVVPMDHRVWAMVATRPD